MPLYRISRIVKTDSIEVEADDPTQLSTLAAREGIVTRSEFVRTVIEEVRGEEVGYREETTADVIEQIRQRPPSGEVRG